MEQIPSDLIDLETARKVTGETWGRLRSWIRAGKVRSWKRGYYMVVSRAEITAFAEEINAVHPASPLPAAFLDDEVRRSK